MAWNLESQSERQKCHPAFLVNSFLLAMEPASQMSGHRDHFGQPIPYPVSPEDRQFLMARATCQFFLLNVMAPVYGSKDVDGTIIVAARAYIQGMLTAGGDAQFNQIYASSFFRKSNLKAVLDVASWDMSPGHDPTKYNPSIFCLLYTSPSPRDQRGSRMPSSA